MAALTGANQHGLYGSLVSQKGVGTLISQKPTVGTCVTQRPDGSGTPPRTLIQGH